MSSEVDFCEHTRRLFMPNAYLEVDARSQDGNQCADAVDGDERKAVLIDAQHHLQAAAHRLDVLVVLKIGDKA